MSTSEAVTPAAATPGPGAAPKKPMLRIEARPGWRALDLAELWRYRELLWFLALRDVKVRYKQTVLGAAWAVLQPLSTMAVFSLFFGYLGGMQRRVEHDIPYPVYTLCALLPWQLFSYALTQSSASVVSSRALLTKVYFPRLLIPMAPLLCGLLDFAISLCLLAAMMVGYNVAGYPVAPGWAVVTLPLWVLLALMTSLAAGLWLSALNAVYRDVQYTLPLLAQVWLFVTPVAYPSSIVPERWRWLYGLNPMAGVVDGFRWALLRGDPPDPAMLVVSVLSVTALLVGGLFWFRRMERTFADLV